MGNKMDSGAGGCMKKPARLLIALLVLGVPLLARAQAGAPLTKAQIEQLNFILSGSWDVRGSFYIPAGTSLPGTCIGTAQTLSKRAFFLTTTNTIWGCTADNTWTPIGAFPNPYTSNQEFSGVVTFTGTTSAPGNIRSVDYTYPGEQPHWLGAVPPNAPRWIDIPIPANQVSIRSLLFIVAEADWTFTICESKTFGGCTFSVLKGSSVGWAGDYGYSEAPIAYVDRDGTGQIHVRAQGADWFTFRALVNYTVN